MISLRIIIGDIRMISTKRAATIMLQTDKDKREALIDKLSEEDLKYLLKQCLSFIHGSP